MLYSTTLTLRVIRIDVLFANFDMGERVVVLDNMRRYFAFLAIERRLPSRSLVFWIVIGKELVEDIEM